MREEKNYVGSIHQDVGAEILILQKKLKQQ